MRMKKFLLDGTPLARRRRFLVVTATAAALVASGGLAISTLIRSPAQVAAETAPPPPSVLTAQVERKVLTATLVMRGRFAGARRYAFTPTSVAPTAHGPGGSVLVVTGVNTHAGAAVEFGAVLLEVSERPIFALPGAFPAYRDLKPGHTGKDVAQLQDGLKRLGYETWDSRGYFGTGTANAVRRFYRDRSYPVPLADPEPPAGSEPDPTPTGPPEKVPMVPMSEVVFLPDEPLQVASLTATVGDVVTEPLITFTADGLTLTARLDPASAALVEVGMEVAVHAEMTGYSGTGTVAAIGEPTRDEATGRLVIPVTVDPTQSWPPELDGQDVRVTITTARTSGEVLAVPVAAISSSADGRTTVTVLTGDGRQLLVEVTVGVSADGWVEVVPVAGEGTPDGLSAGDRVVTGT